MMSILKTLPVIPVNVMVEPIVKQASLSGYTNFDFDFFTAISEHPLLGLKHGLILLDLLGKICLNDPLFGRLASVPFIQ